MQRMLCCVLERASISHTQVPLYDILIEIKNIAVEL